ncbi:MAG: homocysteine S-methyltransferase family protein [bacterium]
MSILEKLKEKVLILDGAMGTEIIRKIGKDFVFPELLNLEAKDIIIDIHRDYIDAGVDIITTNTFGANRIKLDEYGVGSRVEELNIAAVMIAKEARAGREVFIAGSIGPLGKFIRPLGDLGEEEVYLVFSEQARALEKAGADLLLIETQIDILEAKIGLRASKENTSLPVAISISYPLEEGRTVTGSDPEIASIAFSSTDADIFGVNCGGHPEEFESYLEKILHHSDKPVIAHANAGVPEKRGAEVSYPLDPGEYAEYAWKFYRLGASIIGGCCGTTPEHIRFVSEKLKGRKPVERKKEYFFRASSRNSLLTIGDSLPFRLIGENINPFGREKLSQELKEGRLELVRESARKQEGAGADALDVNLGGKGEADPQFFASAVRELQTTVQIPLFLDNNNPHSLELALKSYGGKAVINSVNGDRSSYETLFPLAKKYGASVVLLATDQNGIADEAEERVRIIEKLYRIAIDFGLTEQDLLADPVVLTISTSQKCSLETLKAVEMIKSLGLHTIMGLSNLSFGLPHRKLLNASFLTMAMERGLDSAIANPLDENLMAAIKACDAILGRDRGMRLFVERFGGTFAVTIEEKQEIRSESPEEELFHAVVEGEKTKAEETTRLLLEKGENGFEILEGILSPALRQVGEYYEKKKYFLPQLILSAEAMERASKVLEASLELRGKAKERIKIVIATVRGDLHDIGKNIVALILRNYGYDVVDLGKNVEGKEIVETAVREGANIIGLSALMTTTMEEMRKVVELRNSMAPHIRVVVGGAAVSPSFARQIGADGYCKDAMGTVRKIENLSGESK